MTTAPSQQSLFAPAPPSPQTSEKKIRGSSTAPRAASTVQTPPAPSEEDPAGEDAEVEAAPVINAVLALPMRTRLHRLKQSNLKDLAGLLHKAKKAYDQRPTVAKLDAILRLQREVRALTSELERTVGPDDMMSTVMSVLNTQTEELLKSVSDDFVTLRDQLARGADPHKAVDEAFTRVGSRVVEAHRENRRSLSAVLVDPERAKGIRDGKTG